MSSADVDGEITKDVNYLLLQFFHAISVPANLVLMIINCCFYENLLLFLYLLNYYIYVYYFYLDNGDVQK